MTDYDFFQLQKRQTQETKNTGKPRFKLQISFTLEELAELNNISEQQARAALNQITYFDILHRFGKITKGVGYESRASYHITADTLKELPSQYMQQLGKEAEANTRSA